MQCNNILVPEQFCFREHTATEDEAYKQAENVLKSIDHIMHVEGICYLPV
jgi:hypothetical protein